MPELEIVYKIDGRQKIGNIFYMIKCMCFVDYPFTDGQAMQCPLFLPAAKPSRSRRGSLLLLLYKKSRKTQDRAKLIQCKVDMYEKL